MAIVRLNELPEGSGNLTSDDILVFVDNPGSSGITKKISLSELSAAINPGNPFNQDLNTYNDPIFSELTIAHLEFSGENTDNMQIDSSGLTFPDGTTQTTAASNNPTVVQLGSVSGTISTDASLGDIFDLTLVASGILSNPSNSTDGDTIRWRIKHNANSLTLTLDNKFQIPSSATSPLPFSTSSGVRDLLAATYDQSEDKWDIIAFVPGY